MDSYLSMELLVIQVFLAVLDIGFNVQVVVPKRLVKPALFIFSAVRGEYERTPNGVEGWH